MQCCMQCNHVLHRLRPTDEAEADAIIDGKDYVKNMAVDFSDVIGPHSDDAKEADKIIDTVSFIPLLPMWPARLPWCCGRSRLAVEWLQRAKRQQALRARCVRDDSL